MAVVARYFSTTGNGAADGTSWNDRAALLSAGSYTAAFTGLAFNGSDSYQVFIGPGTYTPTQAMTSALWTNPPSAANQLFLHGCDSSGNALTNIDEDWLSCDPVWTDTTLPVISTSSNIATISLANCVARLLKFTASGRNGSVLTSMSAVDWCVVTNSTANTSAVAVGDCQRLTNSVLSCTGSSYSAVASNSTTGTTIFNNRISGVTGSSGNRHGLSISVNSGATVHGNTILGVAGSGFVSGSTNTAQQWSICRNVIANVGASGILLASTASQTAVTLVMDNMITGCGSVGINAQSAARVIAIHNRLRDNTSGNFNSTLLNFPETFDNYTTDSDDATEYVSTSSDNYRIKSGATIYGKRFGVADQAATGSTGAASLVGTNLVRA